MCKARLPHDNPPPPSLWGSSLPGSVLCRRGLATSSPPPAPAQDGGQEAAQAGKPAQMGGEELRRRRVLRSRAGLGLAAALLRGDRGER